MYSNSTLTVVQGPDQKAINLKPSKVQQSV